MAWCQLFSSRQSDQEGSNENLLNILVVDDQPSVQKMIKKMLYGMGHFKTVDVADDGEVAWSRIKKRRGDQYDVIVTDLYMPKLDGIGLISRCRKSSFSKYIPFLVITGETKPEVLAVLGEMGVRDCLVKPFSSHLFQDRIQMILQRLGDPSEKVFNQISDLAQKGEFARAFAQLEMLSKEEAEKPKWLNLRGEIMLGMGRLDNARECIEKALTFCDTYLTALCNCAKLEEQSGNLAAAVEFLEKADAISPLMVDRKTNLSDLLFQLNREEDGKKMLCKAATITQDHEAKIQIAEKLNERGYDKEADKIIKRLLSYRDINVETYNRIGISLRKQTKYSEAEKTYLSALSYYPNNAAIHYNMGILYLYQLDKWKAADCFKTALIHKPRFANARLMLDYCSRITEEAMLELQFCPNEAYDIT